jgi:hypothetical protein
VGAFVEHIQTLLEDDIETGEIEQQIIKFFLTLLAGPVVNWWFVELVYEDR